MTDNQKLLVEYAQTGSENAFRELVTRHVDLVYSAALRLVGGDTHRAQDVAQTVFVDLARLARTLSPDVMLGGWLHRHACFVATNTMRGERRRQSRERQAVEMNALQGNSKQDFTKVAPLLDEAINELGEADRTAILLRFFEQRDFRSVGEALGSNEDAARMRVNRAVEKLESLLRQRGVTTSAAMLALVLSTGAVQAAPIGLAATISAAALAGTALAASATVTATHTLAMTTIQKTIYAVTLAAAVGTGLYEARKNSRLEGEVQNLHQRQQPLDEEIGQLRRERDALARRQETKQAEIAQLQRDIADLPRLRGEVTQLRMAQQQQAQAKATAADKGDPSVQQFLALKAQAMEITRHLEQRPDKKIPELKLLVDEDWLTAVKLAKFDTDADIRITLSRLRSLAKKRLPFPSALRAFTRANNSQLPADISELKPHLKSALGDASPDEATLDAVLARYKLLHAGNLSDLPPNAWLIAEKAPVDKEYDTRAKFGNGGATIISTGLGEDGDPDDKSY